jgi:hypothetical protein
MKIRSTCFFALSFFAMMVLLIASSENTGKAAGSPQPNPAEEATVSINFEGLMAICFGSSERVSTGLLDVHHHTPEIKITRVKDGSRKDLAILKGEQLRTTFYFDVEGRSNPSVSRYYGESINDSNDFRWNIDLESDLYQRMLYVREDKLFGKIHFSSGLFYAGKRTERPVRFFAADNSGKVLPFNRYIAAPAAKINLSAGEALVIRGGKETIRLTAEPGVRYEIEINNMPAADMADMNHFSFYYDVVGVKVTPYSPVMVKKAFTGGPIICASAVFSRSKLN